MGVSSCCEVPLGLFAFLVPPWTQLILRQFEAVARGPGESQDKGKGAQEGFQRSRGFPPSSSKALLGLCFLLLAFPWAPWNCLKPP